MIFEVCNSTGQLAIAVLTGGQIGRRLFVAKWTAQLCVSETESAKSAGDHSHKTENDKNDSDDQDDPDKTDCHHLDSLW